MLGRAFWGGVIEFARWFSSGGFALWGLGLILLAFHETSFSDLRPNAISILRPDALSIPGDARVAFALPLGVLLILVGALLFLQFGRAKRALMRAG